MTADEKRLTQAYLADLRDRYRTYEIIRNSKQLQTDAEPWDRKMEATANEIQQLTEKLGW